MTILADYQILARLIWGQPGGSMKKVGVILGICAFAMFLHAGRAGAQAAPGPMPPAQQQSPAPGTPEAREAEASAKIVTAYTLPPDVYEKTKKLEKLKLAFFILSPVYGLVLLWLFLRWKLGPKYRNWAEGVSMKFVLQVLIFTPLFILTLDVLSLPLNIIEHSITRSYGLSVQGWGSWAWDWTKGELVSVITGFIFILILYGVIRKSPRRWWLYFWLSSLPLIVFLIFLQPLIIDPLFHKFEPLAQKDPALTVSLERMVQRAGENIPPDRMFWMGASKKSTTLNAYVTG